MKSTAKPKLGCVRFAMAVLAAAFTIAVAPNAFAASSATSAGPGSVSRAEAIGQLDVTRSSIDKTLSLLKTGRRDEAFSVAQAGYLNSFEIVEIPLRVANPGLTFSAEEKFAEIRALIRTGAPSPEIRANIVQLRGVIDEAERQLTKPGLGAPLLAASQAFTILFREGLEAVLLLSILLGYLKATNNSKYQKPLLYGVGLAGVATLATLAAINVVFRILPFGREVLEAVTALLAVVVLFYVSFWLIARLEQRRWMEFLKAKLWNAASAGSFGALMLIGFTAVYREGFETALFFQALTSFGAGLGGWVALGAGVGAVVLGGIAWAILKLGHRMPVRLFLSVAVMLVMATSVTFLGNAIRALQGADVIGFTALQGWPRAPIFLAQATGYWPTVQTVSAQLALTVIYSLGAVYMFGVRPHRLRQAGIAGGAPQGNPGEERAIPAKQETLEPVTAQSRS